MNLKKGSKELIKSKDSTSPDIFWVYHNKILKKKTKETILKLRKCKRAITSWYVLERNRICDKEIYSRETVRLIEKLRLWLNKDTSSCFLFLKRNGRKWFKAPRVLIKWWRGIDEFNHFTFRIIKKWLAF